MAEARQKSDGWLDPVLGARITCHEINWVNSRQFESMQTGGDLYFHKIPQSGTMPHTHDFAEILLINTGGLIHRANGEKQRLTAGSIVFLRPDDLHGFVPDGDFEQAEVVELDFDLDLFLSLSVYFENDAFLQQLTVSVQPPSFLMDAASTNALYTRLLKLNNPAVAPQLRKIKLKILLAELFARFFIDETNLLSESQVPDWLETLCAEMRKEENLIAGLPRMQKLACRTPGHLCKSFQKYLGKTPTDFINELRINHAARLLSDTHDEIVRIADRLRFQSLSRFYHLFKRHYGLSPAAYRSLRSGDRKF